MVGGMCRSQPLPLALATLALALAVCLTCNGGVMAAVDPTVALVYGSMVCEASTDVFGVGLAYGQQHYASYTAQADSPVDAYYLYTEGVSPMDTWLLRASESQLGKFEVVWLSIAEEPAVRGVAGVADVGGTGDPWESTETLVLIRTGELDKAAMAASETSVLVYDGVGGIFMGKTADGSGSSTSCFDSVPVSDTTGSGGARDVFIASAERDRYLILDDAGTRLRYVYVHREFNVCMVRGTYAVAKSESYKVTRIAAFYDYDVPAFPTLVVTGLTHSTVQSCVTDVYHVYDTGSRELAPAVSFPESSMCFDFLYALPSGILGAYDGGSATLYTYDSLGGMNAVSIDGTELCGGAVDGSTVDSTYLYGSCTANAPTMKEPKQSVLDSVLPLNADEILALYVEFDSAEATGEYVHVSIVDQDNGAMLLYNFPTLTMDLLADDGVKYLQLFATNIDTFIARRSADSVDSASSVLDAGGARAVHFMGGGSLVQLVYDTNTAMTPAITVFSPADEGHGFGGWTVGALAPRGTKAVANIGIPLRPRKPANETAYDRLDYNVNYNSQPNPKATYTCLWDDLVFGEELGAGAYGIVVKGAYRGETVAIKKLLLRGASVTEAEVAEFRREADTMQRIGRHENLVRLIGVVSQPERPLCIVIEFVAGGTLEGFIEDKTAIQDLTLRQCVLWSADVARGLAYLHSKRAVHRDIAARNVLLRSNGQAVLADFGMSRICEQTAEDGGVTKAEVGPLRWMAPESIMHREFSSGSDAWAFGALMIELLTLKKPLAAMGMMDAAAFVVAGGHAEAPPHVPEPVVVLLDHLFRFDPSERPGLDEVAQFLAALLAGTEE